MRHRFVCAHVSGVALPLFELGGIAGRLVGVATAMASTGVRSIGDGSMTDGHHSDLLAASIELVDDPIGADP